MTGRRGHDSCMGSSHAGRMAWISDCWSLNALQANPPPTRGMVQRSQGASGQMALEGTQGRQSQGRPSHERSSYAMMLQQPGAAAPAALDADQAEAHVQQGPTTGRKSHESTVPSLARASLSKTGEARTARPSDFGMSDDIERAVAELQVDASGMDR